jgi:hypothetical protein
MRRRYNRSTSKKQHNYCIQVAKYVHQCPNCFRKFPSDNPNYRLVILGSHLKSCRGRSKELGVAFTSSSGEFDEVAVDPPPTMQDISDGRYLTVEQNTYFLECRELERAARQSWLLIKDNFSGEDADAVEREKEFLHCVDLEMPEQAVPDPRGQSRRKGFWYKRSDYVNPFILASSYLCKPEDFEDLYVQEEAPDPCREFLDYQGILIEAYFTGSSMGEKGPMKLNKIGGVPKDWRDCVYIYNFCLKNNCHSNSRGNELLELIRSICRNHGISLPLHKDWRTLQRAVEKKLGELHEIYRYVWTLPAPIFGSVGSDKRPLKPVTGVSYDIMKTIAFQILYVDREHFAASAPVPELVPTRVIRGFETSDFFIRLCATLEREKGSKARPLCIGVGWDESTNRARSIQMTPLVFSFMQVSGESAAIHLGGYFPSGMPHSDQELFRLIRRITKCETISHREQAIKDAKRKFMLEFPHSLLAPLLRHEENGILLQVGTGRSAEIFHFFPFVCTWMMDNEAGDSFCGTNCRAAGMKCRICCDRRCWSMPETALGEFVVRDSQLMAKIASKCEEITILKLLSTQKPSATVAAEWKEIEKERKFFGVTQGANPNYELTKWGERLSLFSLHLLVPPDILHTVAKGMNEMIISATLLLAHSFDFVLGTQGLVKIDNFLKKFPLHQTFSPVRPVKFPEGILCFLKAEALSGSTRSQTTGHVSGLSIFPFLFSDMADINLGRHRVPAHMEAGANPTGPALLHRRGLQYSPRQQRLESRLGRHSRVTHPRQNCYSRFSCCSRGAVVSVEAKRNSS